MNTLAAQLRQLHADLDEMGFNTDESINGGDTVDVIARYMPLINQLPALAAQLEAAGTPMPVGDWAEYKLQVRHDQGFITLRVNAPNIASAIRTVTGAEGCPERAIKNIKRMSP